MLHYDRGTQYTSALYRSTLRKNEELPDSTVVEVIVKLVSNPKFAAMMQEKISMKVDISAIEQEIAAHEKQLRQSYSVKARLMGEIDSLDPDDKHYIWRMPMRVPLMRLIPSTRMISTTLNAKQTLMAGFTRCMIRSRMRKTSSSSNHCGKYELEFGQ